jgi:hypothetical protein
MQLTIEESYQAEKRTPMGACWSGQSWRDHTESPGRLMNRVFGHLADTPEYERFVAEYRRLIQRPDYRRLHTDELFAEYLRLLESGRTRLMTQWKDLQEGLTADGSDKLHEGLAQSVPMNTVTFGHAEGSQRAQSVRVAPAVRLQVQMPLSGSAPLAVGEESVSGIVSATAPAIDMVELHTLVAQERVVPLEKVSMGYHHGLAKGFRPETRTNLGFSDAVKKGVGSWDQ